MTTKVAIVTGANKGIGFQIAKQLLEKKMNDMVVIIACRNQENGEKAKNELGKNCEFMQLDLANNDSIQTFVNNFSKTYKKCDILINNAGLAFKGADPTPHQDQAEPTLRTNFFGTCNFIDNMLPFLKESAKQGCEPRMVNVASMAGKLSQLRQDKQIEISSDKLTMTGLRKMCEDFVISTKQLKHKQEGWSGSNYGMSKCALIAATKIYARENSDIMINAICPGYCATDMSSHRGTRSASDGASNAIHVIQLPFMQHTGEFFQNWKLSKW